ncbi:MarR family winged helix-turn-helix transcriptional regulator (plasmid) [Pseudoalteromonas sp. T1lg65]|uniref:MarR family winged helix-turn-helix transcriptional regulator n=1 Tax=Pseudoalteromonas sp. T1lg65 TaxID=2077101 RepID=UPI003F78FA22
MKEKELLNIQQFLPYQLVSLSTKVSDSFAQVYKNEADLTQPQWRVLSHLISSGADTAKAICELANMDKSTVSRAIKQLEQRQLLTLEPHPEDKRAMHLCVTNTGLALYKQLTPKAKEWEASLMSSLTEIEREQLTLLINKLSDVVES